MLNRDNMTGPWAGLPVAWTHDDRFDESTYRDDVARCCDAGMPGIYTGGTTGEFYAMEFDEFRQVSRATVEECRSRATPVMIGCTSTYTLGAQRRAEVAAELGADAIQVALPFWMELDERQIVTYFEDVARAAGDLALSIYETARAKRRLTLEQHQSIKQALPNYLMVKANDGIGATPEGCSELSKLVNVFVSEARWASLGPRGARGCCSSRVYWNPRFILTLWSRVEQADWAAVNEVSGRSEALHEFLINHFGAKGFTDTAYDRLGARATGFLKTSLRSRGPYPSPNEADVQALRQWLQERFPEMLQLEA